MASRKLLKATLALAAGGLIASSANAAAVVGGSTSVTLTAAPTLTGAGLTVAPTGSATATVNGGIPTVTFPITGGTQDDGTGALLLNHDGSGLLFTSGTNSLAIGNFVVDTTALLVSGDVVANNSDLGVQPLFDIMNGSSLALTSQASGAFNSVFGVNLPAGTVVGTAKINAVTAAVPEAATWTMMLLGFAAMGLAVRRRAPQLAAA